MARRFIARRSEWYRTSIRPSAAISTRTARRPAAHTRRAGTATRRRGLAQADPGRSDQVKRVRLSRGASPPGRSPRRTSSTGGPRGERSAARARPSPSFCQRSDSPATTSAASRAARTSSSGSGASSTGCAATPSACWTASEALASSLLESRPSTEGPARRRGTSHAPASHAPSSIAVQSCSAPTNGTSSGPGAGSPPTSAATSHRAPARIARSTGASSSPARRIDEQQIAVQLSRHPDGVVARIARHEGRCPRGDPVGEQSFAVRLDTSTLRRQVHGIVDQPFEHHLPRRVTRQRASERQQRGDSPLHERDDEHRALRQRRRRQLQRAVLPQDRLLELAQRWARLDPQLVDQRAPRALVRGQRFGLPTAAIQRQHQLPAQPLAQRVLRDQPLELGDEVAVASEREVGLDPLLERREAKLLEPPDSRLRKRLVGEVGERGPAPQPQRRAQLPRSDSRLRGIRLADKALEAKQVKLLALQRDEVARRTRNKQRTRVAQRLSQLRDQNLQRSAPRRGRPLTPQVVEQPISRDNLARVKQQDRQQRPLLGTGERDDPVAVGDLKRAENPKLHRDSKPLAPRKRTRPLSLARRPQWAVVTHRRAS